MKVTVAIDDEVQLKNDIKNLVNAHIKQLAREEAQSLFDAELKRVLQAKIDGISQYTMQDNIKDVLRQAIDKTLGGGWYNQAYVKTEADKYVKTTAEYELRKISFADLAEKTIKDTATKIKDDFLKKLLDK